jgi:putative Mg2+ transporter-C (MgtC) family protein
MLTVGFVAFCQYLLTAFVLGALIGLERQWHNAVAGLRTNILVSVGAAVFVLAGSLTDSHDFRVAAQIVSGIGFIGGGAILREGLTVRGVNTAATLWCSAAIGVLCGFGHIREAAATSAVILFANTVLRPVTYFIQHKVEMRREIETQYLCRVGCRTLDEMRLRKAAVQFIETLDLLVRSIHSEANAATGVSEIKIAVASRRRDDLLIEKVVDHLNEDAGVTALSWERMEHGGTGE